MKTRGRTPADLQARIDGLLAAAIRGEVVVWPADWESADMRAAFVERGLYHGIAGLLIRSEAMLVDWPAPVVGQFRRQARAQAMWELRHRQALSTLLAELARTGVHAVVLKGTALAYDLYDNPAARGRSDTDLLIDGNQLAAARAVLAGQGYSRDPAVEREDYQHARQELWNLTCADGTAHQIDLHWQALNTPALDGVLTLSECLAKPLPLPRLCETAVTMERPLMLLHAAMHRAIHVASPYYLGSVAFHGGDRLIWARDFDLLARSLSEADWQHLCRLTREKGLGTVCRAALALAEDRFGTAIPSEVARALEGAPASAAESYLLASGPFSRAWRDLRAVAGFRTRLSYIFARLFPSPPFMRVKYPSMRDRPLALLHLRRLVELLRRRPGRSEH